MTSADCFPDGPILVLNGCEERLQMVIGSFSEQSPILMAAQEWTVPGRSVGFIAPGIKAMLDGLQLTCNDLAGVACVRGPGSFTGLRIILSSAAGIAAGAALPTAGIDYLPLLASGLSVSPDHTIHVVTYARRGQVYLQSFRSGDAMAPALACSAEEAVSHIAGQGGTVTGSGIRKNHDTFLSLREQGVSLLPQRFDTPCPLHLLEAGLKAHYDHKDIAPLYIRASDAENDLDRIAEKRGLDPEEARKRLHGYE